MIRTVAALFFLLALAAPSARAEEPITLAWRFEKGDRFYLLYESAMVTETELVLGENEQGESNGTRERTLLRVRVEEVRPDASARLSFRLLRTEVEMKTPRETIRVVARRDETGAPMVAIDGGSEDEGSAAFGGLLRPLLAAYMDLPVQAQIRPTGELVSMTMEGDPFDAVEPKGSEEEILLGALRGLFTFEEVLRAALAQTFVRLPAEPVRPGDVWAVSRAFQVAGVGATGRGEARLAGMTEREGVRLARIEERTHYDVDTGPYVKRYTGMLKELMTAMGVDVAMDLTLQCPDGMELEAHAEFAPGAGRVAQVYWKDQSIAMEGSLTMTLMGSETTGPMKVRARGLSVVRLGADASLLDLPSGVPELTLPEHEAARVEEAQVEKAKAQLANFETAIQMYYLQHRRLPHTLDVLTEASERTGEAFLDGVPEDPWGRPYELKLLDSRKFLILSHGPDGVSDTDDDIVWPQPD